MLPSGGGDGALADNVNIAVAVISAAAHFAIDISRIEAGGLPFIGAMVDKLLVKLTTVAPRAVLKSMTCVAVSSMLPVI